MKWGAGKPATAEPEEVSVTGILIESGKLTADDLDKTRSLSAKTGRPVHLLLDRMGLISQHDWVEACSRAYGLPVVSLETIPNPLPNDERLSRDYLKRNGILPLSLDGDAPRFAVADPGNTVALNALRLAFGDDIDLALATDRDLETAFARSDAPGKPGQNAAADAQMEAETSGADYLMEIANDAPTIKYVDTLINRAVERKATDIHLEPLDGSVRARLRLDGILSEVEGPSSAIYAGVVSRLKILADLDIAERRLPQDGRITQKVQGRSIDIRLATAPTVHGEAITLRLLDTDAGLKSLSDLKMPAAIRKIYKSALAEPNGLILVTGPTGSGKTTTLHAALSGLNDVGRKIVTIENPVEIHTPGLIQIETSAALGWTFANALRTILRHDPDILMVGEIRDAETAELAVRSAMTGHLVLSTLHTNTATEALTRLRDLGVPDYLISSVVRMVAAQRLVRQVCTACAKPARIKPNTPSAETYRHLAALDPKLPPVEEWDLRLPQGCAACNNTGYSGRLALFEAISGEDALGTLSGTATRRHRTMGIEGLSLVASGHTTLNELVRVVGNPQSWT